MRPRLGVSLALSFTFINLPLALWAHQCARRLAICDLRFALALALALAPALARTVTHPHTRSLAHSTVRVSPLALGAMSIGDQWTGFMGNALGKEKAFEILDAY